VRFRPLSILNRTFGLRPLSALSRRWLLAQHPTALDPEATFTMNGRKLEKADFG
jgi:hypothetical protein